MYSFRGVTNAYSHASDDYVEASSSNATNMWLSMTYELRCLACRGSRLANEVGFVGPTEVFAQRIQTASAAFIHIHVTYSSLNLLITILLKNRFLEECRQASLTRSAQLRPLNAPIHIRGL